jgi:tRNA nucleotidyltransferase (CCA-adding enzyme)
MIVITTHLNADFDCLASMAAAHKLYPSAIMIFPGSQEKSVRNFLEKSGFPLPIRRLKKFDLSQVKKLVVVDTTSRERLGPIGELCDRQDVEIEIYDHHPAEAGDIRYTNGRVAPRGANATLMTEILRERNMEISPEEATLFMLGIYEDTGSLTFSSTRPEDFRAAEFLLQKGANLNVVSDFLHRELNAEQVKLLHELLNRLEFHNINGVEIATAIGSAERYVGDIAVVVHALKDMEYLDALFVIVEMEGRLHFIGRSRIQAVDAAQVAERFGGGGHATASSATIRNMLVSSAKKDLLDQLKKVIPPAPTAEQLMVSPVISVGKKDSINSVEKILTRQNINGLPVLDHGTPAGLITRQIVEKLLYHGLGEAAVEEYMQTEIATVKKNTAYETIQNIIIHQKQKLLPVCDDSGKMMGVIGRMDVIRAIYSDFLKSASSMLYPHRRIHRNVARDLSGVIRERLPAEVREIFKRIADCADSMGYSAYAVGGFVRDMLMRRANLDIDIVVEGDGIAFAHALVERYGGRAKTHSKFKTAIVVLPGGRKIDVATARTEYYTEPAALPIVELSSIKNDLYRRDFTINALAVKLNGTDKNRLIDFFGGQQDIKDGVIRVLHNLSFIEDPTRIFRAIRFEERFHFSLGSQTESLMKLAIRKELVNRISGARLFGELYQIFNEEHLERATRRIASFGLWEYIHPAVQYDEQLHSLIENARETVYWHRLTFENERIKPWLVYLLCLSGRLGKNQTVEFFQRLGFSGGQVAKFVEEKTAGKNAAACLEKTKPQSPVVIYERLNHLKPETLLTVMAGLADRAAKHTIVEYMTSLRYVKPKVSGHDLMQAGLKSGPLLGMVMRAIQRENLKEALPTVSDEISFAKKFYRFLKNSHSLKPAKS